MDMVIHFGEGDRVDATFDGITITTDQDGSAPSPVSLFLASIGTCAGYYVSRFCRQRGISTRGLRIVQHVQRNESTHLADRIELDVELPHDFPEKYADAAVRAAGQCTVKRHLEAPPTIVVRAVTLSR